MAPSCPSGPGSAAFDAAVVGSGPNGLAAALALTLAGREVVVYERAAVVGGSARTEPLTLPGFHHDACSSIHPMAAASPFLRSLPLQGRGLRWLHSPAVVAHPLDDAPAAVQYRDLERTAATLGPDGRRWAQGFSTFVEGFDRLLADAMAPPGLARHPLLLGRFGVHALLPATTLARSLFRGPAARALFAGHAAHSVLPLDQVGSSAIGLMLMLAGHVVGWPFPQGGAQALTDAMARLLVELGGTIRTGVHIDHLDACETTGPVLFQTGPRALADICGDALPAGYRRRLRRFRYGPGVFKVDWALAEPIPWRDPAVAEAATVHLGGTMEALAVSERAAWRGEHCERPFVLLTQPGRFDPTRAPVGRSTAWGYCHVPAGSTEDMTDAIEAQVERFAPGFRDCILARHRRDSVALEAHDPNLVGGDVNGGAASLDQLLTRPVAAWDPYATPNPRVFLCSASTPPGGGVHGMAGWFAACSALGHPRRRPDPGAITATLERMLGDRPGESPDGSTTSD